MRFIRYIFVLVLLLTTVFAKASSTEALDSIKLESSLITCYPGPKVYELYGHTAIRIQSEDFDFAFNYGIFNFSEPNFTYRFVKGTANYILAFYDFQRFLTEYVSRGSKVVEQKLNLSDQQNKLLLQLLLENAQIENRSYRYNYIYDNCSTRPRDMIEKVVGSSIKYPAAEDSTLTFRDIMRQYNKNYSWQSFGIDLALGKGLDFEISAREQMFAPIYLQKTLDKTTFTDENGNTVPLVKATEIINDGSDEGVILPPTEWYMTPTFFGIILVLLTIATVLVSLKKNRKYRAFDTLIYVIYGCAGCIIFFLIFVSTHAATSPNNVALWLNPLYFIPAILIWIKKASRFLYFYQIANFAVIIVAFIGWWIFQQEGDIAFLPLMLVPATLQLKYIIKYKRCERKGK